MHLQCATDMPPAVYINDMQDEQMSSECVSGLVERVIYGLGIAAMGPMLLASTIELRQDPLFIVLYDRCMLVQSCPEDFVCHEGSCR